MSNSDLDTTPTALRDMPALARACRLRRVLLKAENERQLGNFKSLGGTTAVDHVLARVPWETGAALRVLCASDGNHGLAVAAAAARRGISARVYLPSSTAPERIERIQRASAEVHLVDGTYDAAVLAAQAAAALGEGELVPDTSDDPEDEIVLAVMEGYRRVAREVADQLTADDLPRPTHMFVQAGVGGFAAAMAGGLRGAMASDARIVIVEPERAGCVGAALEAGQVIQIGGGLESEAAMLSCGRASAAALAILRAFPAQAMLVNEEAVATGPRVLAKEGIATTPSGAAGVVGLLKASQDRLLRRQFNLGEHVTALVFVTEAA